MKKLPHSSQIASLDVDCQKTFSPLCPQELPIPDALSIVTQLNAQALFADFRLGSKDAHSPAALWLSGPNQPSGFPLDLPQAKTAWPVHAIPGTLGFELLDGLPSTLDYDYFVWKGIEIDRHPYGACYQDVDEKQSTGLIEFCLVNGIKTILLGGLALDYCVKTTALQLRKADFDVILNLAATAGLNQKTMDEALSQMRAAGVEFVSSTADFYQN